MTVYFHKVDKIKLRSASFEFKLEKNNNIYLYITVLCDYSLREAN